MIETKVLSKRALAYGIALAAAGMTANSMAESFSIEEVIVTAQKRAQTLQEVPVAVSAFSEDFMARAGVEDVRGLVAMTPGFAGASEDSYIDGMSMRGISTNDFGIGGDPSIAMFQDGFWLGRNGGVQNAYFDIERVEVVKGPQATLFGRNAIAGAVSVTTNKPVDEFEGKIGLGLAEENHRELTATINIPLTEKLYFRGSVYGMENDGWLENLQGGDDFGFHKNSGTRLALRYAGDTVDATITASYEDREQNSSIYWDATNNIGLNTPKNKANSNLLGEDAIDEGEIASVVANVEVELRDDLSLTSITGWKTFNHRYLEDNDGNPLPISELLLDNSVEYISQEFRLNGETEKVTWFAGISAYEETIESTLGYNYNEDELCAAISRTETADFPGGPVPDCSNPGFWQDYWGGGAAPAPGETLANAQEYMLDEVNSNGWGVYGDATLHVDDALDITYGVRYTEDTKKMTMASPDTGGWLGNNILNLGPLAEVSETETWDEITHRLAANYQLNEDIAFYASYSQGYKSGGFGSFGVDAAGTPDAFDPETVDSYEVGTKTQWLEGRLNFNAALYHFTYDDMQLTHYATTGYADVENIGEAEVTGIEMDLRYLPAENVDIYFAASYQDSEVGDETELRALGVCVVCEGNQLPLAPKATAALMVTYTIPVESGEFYATFENQYSAKQYSDLDNSDVTAQDRWSEIHLRFGYDSAEDWSVKLWVENVASDEHFERAWNQEGYGFNNLQTWTSRPRTVGVNFDMSF